MRTPAPFPAPLPALLAALLACLASADAAAFAQQTYQVPMRDGVTLATEVWRPDGAVAARPVILRRTPYGRAMDAGTVNALLYYGYTVVSQDVRGRGDSGGEFVPFMDDHADGPDTMTWVAAQPFCNGKIGTYGGSAEGIVQLMAAPEAPAALECAHVGVATGDLYEGIMPGGAWRKELTTDWLNGLGEPAALTLLRSHEAGDAYWDPARLTAAKRATVKAPMLLYGGFFDIFAKDTVKAHRLLQQEADASARGDMFLVLGPWTHGGTGNNVQGEVSFPADAAYRNLASDLSAWLSWCLQAGTRPRWQAVRYYRMELSDDGKSATGQWLGADAWPPPATATAFYVHSDGALTTKVPASGIAWTLHSDPAAPIPSKGGGNLTTAAGPLDQSGVDALSDVMTATTLPATEDVVIVGDVTARVWAASSSTDADAIVRLSEVTPSGRVLMLADGIRRGRFVAGTDAIRPMTPGQVVAFDIEVGPVSFVLPKGHALRMSIQTTSSPRYEVNPGVATPLAQGPTPVAYDLTVYRDGTYPSSITLPIVSGTLPEPPGLDAGVSMPDASHVARGDAEVQATDDAGQPIGSDDAGTTPAGDTGGASATADGDGGTVASADGPHAVADTGPFSPHAPGGCSCSATSGGVPTFLVLVALAFGLVRRHA